MYKGNINLTTQGFQKAVIENLIAIRAHQRTMHTMLFKILSDNKGEEEEHVRIYNLLAEQEVGRLWENLFLTNGSLDLDDVLNDGKDG